MIASPLTGDSASLIDADALAARLRRAIAERNLILAPKVSVVVDAGGRLHLDSLTADIRLCAVNTATESMLHIALAGDAASAIPLGLAKPDAAVEIVSDLLAAIAALGPDARAADLLRAPGLGDIRAMPCTRLEAASHLPSRPRAEPIALHRLKNGACALGLGLAFGHIKADALIELMGIAKMNGAQWVRPAPDRALLLGPLTEAKADGNAKGREAAWLHHRCARSAPAHRRLPRRAVLRLRTDCGASDCRPTRGPSPCTIWRSCISRAAPKAARIPALLLLPSSALSMVAASSATARLATRRRPSSPWMTFPPLSSG